MDSLKNNPKTTAVGAGASILALTQAIALLFGFELEPAHYALITTLSAALTGIVGLVAKDGNKP